MRKQINCQNQLVNVISIQYKIQSLSKNSSSNYNHSKRQSQNSIYLCNDKCFDTTVLVNLKIITERISYRLGHLIQISNRKLSKNQAKLILTEILQAYIILEKYNIHPQCSTDKIGLNSKGNVKFWISQVYGLNQKNQKIQNQPLFLKPKTIEYKINILKSIFQVLIQNIQKIFINQFLLNLPFFVISNQSNFIQNYSGLSFYVENQSFFKTVKKFLFQSKFLHSQNTKNGSFTLKELINILNKFSLKQYTSQLSKIKRSQSKLNFQLKTIQKYDSLNKSKIITYQYKKRLEQIQKINQSISLQKYSDLNKKKSKKSLKNKIKSSNTLHEKYLYKSSQKQNVNKSLHKILIRQKQQKININASQQKQQKEKHLSFNNNNNEINVNNFRQNISNNHKNITFNKISFEKIQNKAFINKCIQNNQLNKNEISVSLIKNVSIKQKSLFKMKTQVNENVISLINQIEPIKQQIKESDKSQEKKSSQLSKSISPQFSSEFGKTDQNQILKSKQLIKIIQQQQIYKKLKQNQDFHLLQARIQQEIKEINSQVQIITNNKKNLSIDSKYDPHYNKNSILLQTPTHKCLPTSSQSNIYNKLDPQHQSWKNLQYNINKSKVDSTINGSNEKSDTNPGNSTFLRNSINIYGSLTHYNNYNNYNNNQLRYNAINNTDRVFTKNNPLGSVYTNNFILLKQNGLQSDKICQSKNQLKNQEQQQQKQSQKETQRRFKTEENSWNYRKYIQLEQQKSEPFEKNYYSKQYNKMFLTVSKAKDLVPQIIKEPKSQAVRSDEKHKIIINSNKHINHLYHHNHTATRIQNLSSRKSFTVSVFDQQESSDSQSIILISAKNITNFHKNDQVFEKPSSSIEKSRRQIHFQVSSINNSNHENCQQAYTTPYLMKKPSSNQQISSTGKFINKIIDSEEIISIISSHNDPQLQKI